MKSLKIGQIFNYPNSIPLEHKIRISQLKPKKLIETVMTYLTKYGFYGTISTNWSNLSGCTACPCAPGWDVLWYVPDIHHVQEYAETFKRMYKHPANRFWFFDEGNGVRVILPHHSSKDAKGHFISYENTYHLVETTPASRQLQQPETRKEFLLPASNHQLVKK